MSYSEISSLTPYCCKMLKFFNIFFLFLSLTLSCAMPFFSTTFLSFSFSFSFSFSDHHTLSISVSNSLRDDVGGATPWIEALRWQTPQAPPPHFENPQQNANKDDIVLKPKQHERFGVRFRNRLGFSLGFGFEIGLSTAQMVMVVRPLISPARWCEGEEAIEGREV